MALQHRCPACGSDRTACVVPRFNGTVFEACAVCSSVWEGFDPGTPLDPRCSQPCGNCAFRPGSPEQQNPEAWKCTVAALSYDPETGIAEPFWCHKGLPLLAEPQDGAHATEFRWPRWPEGAGGEDAVDTRRLRLCSGWLNMIRVQRAKAASHV